MWLTGQEAWAIPASFWASLGLLLALIGWIVRAVVAREMRRTEQAEVREQAMRDKVDDRIIPLLSEATRVLAEATSELAEARSARKRSE